MHENTMTAIYGSRQDRAVAAVSAQQIRALLPDEELDEDQIEAVRRCSSPKPPLGHREIEAHKVIFRLFRAFEDLPDVDTPEVRAIQRWWLERFLRATPWNRWLPLLRSGLIGSSSRRDPVGLVQCLLVRLPVRMARRALRVGASG